MSGIGQFFAERFAGPDRSSEDKAVASPGSIVQQAQLEMEQQRLEPRFSPQIRSVKGLGTHGWTPHSPRSALHRRIPDSAKQKGEMEMLLLQANPKRNEIRERAWKGCSTRNRAAVWRLIVGYEPLLFDDRKTFLNERRREYRKLHLVLGGPTSCTEVDCHPDEQRSSFAAAALRQIRMDLPRTHPGTAFFHIPCVRLALQRILYLFAVLHPETGYVQGMNEIASPLFLVFASEYLEAGKSIQSLVHLRSLEGVLTDDELSAAEADTYWTLAAVLSEILECFVENQPGLQYRIAQLEALTKAVDPPLASHLASEGCKSLEFSFRWVAVLLSREFRLPLVVRLWDALLSIENGFGDYLVFVCAALLINWRDELLAMDFPGIMTLLLNLPTGGWGPQDIDMLLCQARVWSSQYKLC